MSGSSVGEDVTVFDFIELLQASDWVSSPVYAGWLQKKSKGWLVSSLFTQFAWQPKWVSLHGLELIYMDEEPTNENIASISIRRTSIGSTTKIMPYCEEDRQDPLAFSIQPDCTKPRVWQFRAESEEEKTNWLIKISQVHAIAAWLDSYTKEKVLGVGAQGTVYEIVHKSTGQRYAMKEVNIENEKQMQMAITEAKLLKEITKNVCHPCIMQIEKVFQVVDKFYLVFPLCTGGELYDAVVRRGHFTERKAARIIRDVISALQALHEYNVLHLDIKPENILFESDEPNARVKITDFGLSKIFTPETVEIQNRARPTNEELAARAESFINCGNFNADHVRGTFGYMSPELILSGYCSTASDVFAAGVILYILLCGYPPFNSKSVRQLFVRTVRGAYKLTGPEWDSISPEAKDLVRKMLDISPETRITTYGILAHPWIQKAGDFDSYAPEKTANTHAESAAAGAGNDALVSGLHGKSSIVHGHLLRGSLVDGAAVTAAMPSTPGGKDSEKNLSRALDHLADHIKVLKTEKLAKTVTRLMLAKHSSGPSKLSMLYLIKPATSGTTGTTAAFGSALSSAGSLPVAISVGTSTKSGVLTMAPIVEEDSRWARYSYDQDDDLSNPGSTGGSTKSLVLSLVDAEGTQLDDVSDRIPRPPSSVTPKQPINSTGNIFDELQQMVNSEAKEAIIIAMFAYFGADAQHRLSIAQGILMIKRIGLIGANTAIPARGTDKTAAEEERALANIGLFGLLSAKLADKEGKGYLTPEDFFSVQVLILQRSESYLRAIFKQYQHSLWYPGRPENFAAAAQTIQHSVCATTGTAPTGAGAAAAAAVKSADSFITTEPPEYITAKHVSAVFERYGFNPRSGHKVFNLLCDVLAKLKSERRHSSYGSATPSPLDLKSESTEEASVSPVIGDGDGLQMHDQMTRAAKGMIVQRVRGMSENDILHSGSGEGNTGPSTPIRRMYLEEFIHVSKMDEVLVDVMSKDAHQRMFTLFQKVEVKYLAHREAWEKYSTAEEGMSAKLLDVIKTEVARILDDPNF